MQGKTACSDCDGRRLFPSVPGSSRATGSTLDRFTEGKLVNKSQLIDTLAARFEGNRKQAAHALESVLDTITREVAKGEKVAITGFGSFEKRVRDARWVRNPRTGERIKAKKTAVPKFSAGADLKAVVSGAKKLPKLTVPAASTAPRPLRRSRPRPRRRRRRGHGQEDRPRRRRRRRPRRPRRRRRRPRRRRRRRPPPRRRRPRRRPPRRRRPRRPREEDGRQEGAGQEDRGQEDGQDDGRRRRPRRRRRRRPPPSASQDDRPRRRRQEGPGEEDRGQEGLTHPLARRARPRPAGPSSRPELCQCRVRSSDPDRSQRAPSALVVEPHPLAGPQQPQPAARPAASAPKASSPPSSSSTPSGRACPRRRRTPCACMAVRHARAAARSPTSDGAPARPRAAAPRPGRRGRPRRGARGHVDPVDLVRARVEVPPPRRRARTRAGTTSRLGGHHGRRPDAARRRRRSDIRVRRRRRRARGRARRAAARAGRRRARPAAGRDRGGASRAAAWTSVPFRSRRCRRGSRRRRASARPRASTWSSVTTSTRSTSGAGQRRRSTVSTANAAARSRRASSPRSREPGLGEGGRLDRHQDGVPGGRDRARSSATILPGAGTAPAGVRARGTRCGMLCAGNLTRTDGGRRRRGRDERRGEPAQAAADAGAGRSAFCVAIVKPLLAAAHQAALERRREHPGDRRLRRSSSTTSPTSTR